ncbi:MAG: carboxylesterase family protein [Blautia sp.]|nr:carboxylesterase family protein [Lachnoclostridium sp.]MCM1211251.1 carboxylesterase family protein [Blautia sp.]
MEKEFIYKEDTALVETKSGKVRGYFYDDTYIFKGIPYAKARRFHAPEPVEPWDDVFLATNYGYVCPLLDMPKPNGELTVPHRYWVMNEDCQNLNIWTPGLDDKKRPVMVWLHGGGYYGGSSIEQVAYEGGNMSKFGQVVVVSLNHRLNILGYCDFSPFGEEYANSGNAGTDDIIAALKWLHENIEKFGGDPDNVIVFGQSGGGSKVTTLLQTPEADGLYAKGVNMSGVISEFALKEGPGDGEKLGNALMEALGVDTIKALETVPYDALAAAYHKVLPALEKEGAYVGGTPYVNAFYKGDPLKNGFRKETEHIPLMVGSVFGEFSFIVPAAYNRSRLTKEGGVQIVEQTIGKEAAKELISLFQEAYPKRHPVDVMTLDFLFRSPEIDYIRERSKCSGKVWSYLFNLDMNIDGGRTPLHCADIPFFFHNTQYVPYTQEKGVTERVEKLIFDSIMAFAKTGNPQNPEVPEWDFCTPEREVTLIIDKESTVRENFDHKLIPVLEKYMAPVYARIREEQMKNVQH